MKTFDARRAAVDARASNSTRPATAIVHDTPDARVLVFRIAPGQTVSPHRNGSTVILTVLSGHGIVTGGDARGIVSAGEVIAYEPNELHGMSAVDAEVVLLATITPRPSARSVAVAPAADAARLEASRKPAIA
jgi:quercetin dioxygenase-like cupin family protein